MKGWDHISNEEQVERLRKMVLLLGAVVVVLAAVCALLAAMVNKVDREVHPVKPHKTEQHGPMTAWT
jgi:flagellar basal body-associated protein FliL